MFYSLQLDSNDVLFCKGRHQTNTPPTQDTVPGAAQLLITNNLYPDIKHGMKFSSTDGGFYELDEYGNTIPESFVEYNG